MTAPGPRGRQTAGHTKHVREHESPSAHSPRMRHSLNRLALIATLHCLIGCALGESLGMVLASHGGWDNVATIAVSTALAFTFGYAFTLIPLLRARLPLAMAFSLALASDTASIAIMEVVDNATMMLIPGAMNAHWSEPRFWLALVLSLLLAAVAAFPLNRWLIARGKGHAVVHAHHSH